ncbi:hypothetical protein P879_03754 [Paragonimus westermani]|uniref:Uncharacterized protein n=1 Tax=Paragonimus westermani TaxID=34504 RepID=A0A8T0DPA9_9TREM|nr:hypothetical protein P879_03754 [Paragonimus westermani]
MQPHTLSPIGYTKIIPQRIGDAKCAVPMQAWMMEMEEEKPAHLGRPNKSISSFTQAKELTTDMAGGTARTAGLTTGSDIQRKVELESALHAIEQLWDKEEPVNYRHVHSRSSKHNNATGTAKQSKL